MADETPIPNSLSTSKTSRSTIEGDVPESMRRRYYTDGRGGAGLGYFADATVLKPEFRDQGNLLVAERSDPQAIRDMTTIAQHRGWVIVTARGSNSFRREAWLVGRSAGLEVRGYRPSERDVQELDRRIDRRQARAGGERGRAGVNQATLVPAPLSEAAKARLRVVEAVVKDRIADEPGRERVLAAARDRIATWLEKGAGFAPMPAKSPTIVQESEKRRERLR